MMKSKAFTLMELLVVVTIVAVLAVVAVPAYRSYVLKSHRADAINSLVAIQIAEEKYRISNNTYGTLAQVWNGVTTTEGGYFTLSISNVSATSYTITANAVGSQASDSQDGSSCATFTLSYSSGATTKTPSACWME